MMITKRLATILGLSTALGLSLFVATQARPVAPLFPVAQAAPTASISRIDLEGQDVARLLQLQAYKWRYQLPEVAKGQTATGVFWIEEWKRNDTQPKITELFSIGLQESKGTLLVKLPASQTDKVVVATEGTTLSQSGAFNPFIQGSFTRALGKVTLVLERDLILVALTRNEKGGYISDSNILEFPRTNDRTIYFKVRFTTGSNKSPVWKNGKVVLEK